MTDPATNPDYATIRARRLGPVLTIELNRPPLNILDMAMMREIQAALDAVANDASLRLLVFRAAGEKAFCAGVSIQDHLPERITEMIPLFHGIFRFLARTDLVTVAAVQGHCLGGGLELVSMCDLVLATDTAQFGQPEIKLGQMPPVGVILLPRLLGYRKAAELVLTGNSISAAEAHAAGLINRVVPAGQLATALDGLVAELTSLSGSAVHLAKHMLRRVSAHDFERLLDDSESFFLNRLIQTPDAQEGITAFLEKRPARWSPL